MTLTPVDGNSNLQLKVVKRLQFVDKLSNSLTASYPFRVLAMTLFHVNFQCDLVGHRTSQVEFLFSEARHRISHLPRPHRCDHQHPWLCTGSSSDRSCLRPCSSSRPRRRPGWSGWCRSVSSAFPRISWSALSVSVPGELTVLPVRERRPPLPSAPVAVMLTFAPVRVVRTRLVACCSPVSVFSRRCPCPGHARATRQSPCRACSARCSWRCSRWRPRSTPHRP